MSEGAAACDGQMIRYAQDLARLYRLEKERDEDIRSGAAMQRRFLTPDATVRELFHGLGYDAALFNRAPAAISGDFFCARALGRKGVGFFLADACGHGLSAALISMRISSLVQTAAPRSKLPSRFLAAVNEDIAGLDLKNRFVASVYAVLQDDCCTVSNAGQPFPLHVHKGRLRELQTSGPPLGLGGGKKAFRDLDCPMAPGDKLILFTDGVVEAANKDEELYGKDRFYASIREHMRLAPDEMCVALIRDMDAFVSPAVLDDDVTLAVIARRCETCSSNVWRTMAVKGDEESQGQAMATVLQDIQTLSWPEVDADLFHLALVEMLINAVEHGHGNDPAKEVGVGYCLCGQVAVVAVSDSGKGHTPRFPDLKTVAGARGRGLGMIRDNADVVLFNHAANEIVIIKGVQHMHTTKKNVQAELINLPGAVHLAANVEFSGHKTAVSDGMGELCESMGSGPRRLFLDMRHVRILNSMAWGALFAQVEDADILQVVLFNASEALRRSAEQMALGSRGEPYSKIEIYADCVEAMERMACVMAGDGVATAQRV